MVVKAQLGWIKTGALTFNGLMSESGEFGIPENSAIIDYLEPELNFQTVTWVVNGKKVKVIALADFDFVLRSQDGGNGTPAADIIYSLLGKTLEEVFIEAFKVI